MLQRSGDSPGDGVVLALWRLIKMLQLRAFAFTLFFLSASFCFLTVRCAVKRGSIIFVFSFFL